MKILVVVITWFCQTLLMSSTVTAQGGCVGDCISILDCPSLNQILQNIRTNRGGPNDLSILRKAVCANDGKNIRVCCPRPTRINPPRNTPRPFTSRPVTRVTRPQLTNRKCGINLQTDKIVNGEIAEFGSWPWMVIFRASRIISSGGSCSDSNPSCSGWAARGECDRNPAFMHANCKKSCNKCSTVTGPSNWICGGTLITEQYVLSAAHCFKDDVKIEFARVGEYDLSKSIDEGFGLKAPQPQDIDVERVIRHHSYERPCLRCNDIALVKLAKPAQLHNFFVYPICLPSNPLQDMGFSVSQFQGKLAMATGWGVTDPKNIFTTRTADILHQVNLTIQERQYCHQQKRKYPDSRMILCAGQGDGRDVCRADSGGPLMLSDGFSQRWYVVGVTSFGPTICGDRNAQGVFTSIHYYIDWIMQNIQ